MPEEKKNRRVRFTRAALREALISLMLEKPLVTITVKDICARADINRSTFYLHYKDVTDLLRTTEDEIISHMQEHMPAPECKFHDYEERKHFFVEFLDTIKENPRMMKLIQVLCSEQGDPYFVRQLQRLTYDAFMRSWDINMLPKISENEKFLVYSFIVSGVVAMLSAWATKTQDVSTEQVAERLMGLISYGVDSLLTGTDTAQ